MKMIKATITMMANTIFVISSMLISSPSETKGAFFKKVSFGFMFFKTLLSAVLAEFNAVLSKMQTLVAGFDQPLFQPRYYFYGGVFV